MTRSITVKLYYTNRDDQTVADTVAIELPAIITGHTSHRPSTYQTGHEQALAMADALISDHNDMGRKFEYALVCSDMGVTIYDRERNRLGEAVTYRGAILDQPFSAMIAEANVHLADLDCKQRTGQSLADFVAETTKSEE